MTSDADARAFLREHFLRTISKLNGTSAVFSMHSNLTLEGTFECSSADLKYLQASELKTPFGKIKSSILRSSDVISVEFKPSSLMLDDKVMPTILENLSQIKEINH